MPNKNTIRSFEPHATYHVYNRGVAKQTIFLDPQDYRAFIRRLELMLLPKESAEKLQHATNRIRIQNLHGLIDLQAFCLMPNHFHLMVTQQQNPEAVTTMMRVLSTSYSMYFNQKYKRVGPVFQGRYKAAVVDTDMYMLHLSRYIHCNPSTLGLDIYTYPYSSLQYYFSETPPKWLNSKKTESQFPSEQAYREFIKDLQDLQSVADKYEL